jgi:hypothetical protein
MGSLRVVPYRYGMAVEKRRAESVEKLENI